MFIAFLVYSEDHMKPKIHCRMLIFWILRAGGANSNCLLRYSEGTDTAHPAGLEWMYSSISSYFMNSVPVFMKKKTIHMCRIESTLTKIFLKVTSLCEIKMVYVSLLVNKNRSGDVVCYRPAVANRWFADHWWFARNFWWSVEKFGHYLQFLCLLYCFIIFWCSDVIGAKNP
jgi:hypothetical protein